MPLTSRSLSTPITLTSVAVALSLALLVGWTLLVVDTLSTGTTWFLILGVVSIAFITTVLLMSGVALAREIVEGRKQRTFVDSVTHELKSPLASLGLCLETLSRSDLTEEQRTELRSMMRHDVERLSAFIDDVLIASKLVHEREVETRPRPVKLGEVLGRAIERAVRRHPGRGEVGVSGDPELCLTADATALETILRNLIDNAMKYGTPAETFEPGDRVLEGVADPGQQRPVLDATASTVEVSYQSRGERVVIEVVDRGIGISEEDLPRVFRRFYRVDDESVRARPGTGLGLYVASELARQLGGELSARSEGRGRGTTFTLALPRDAKGQR